MDTKTRAFSPRHHRAVYLAAVAVSLLLPLPTVCAQDKPADPGTQNPDLTRNLSLDAGYLVGLRNRINNAFYYRLEYKGDLVGKKGTPFKFANPNEPVAASAGEAAKTRSPESFSDTHALDLRFDRGTGNVDGGLFDLLGVKQFQLPGALRDLRGAARLSGRLDGDQFNASIGIETPPYHPFKFLNGKSGINATNWLIFGFAGEHQERSGTAGTDQDVALATFRAFLGRGFGWVRSDRQLRFQASLEGEIAEILKQVEPTGPEEANVPPLLRRARLASDAIKKSIREGRGKYTPTRAEASIRFLVDEERGGQIKVTSDEDWTAAVKTHVLRYLDVPDRPRYALWIEDSGFYSLNDVTGQKRFNNFLAATATYWLNPRSDSPTFLRVRYERGNDRSAPAVKKDAVIFSVGANF